MEAMSDVRARHDSNGSSRQAAIREHQELLAATLHGVVNDGKIDQQTAREVFIAVHGGLAADEWLGPESSEVLRLIEFDDYKPSD